MTEFDFDELDKAVSSLMKKTPREKEPEDSTRDLSISANNTTSMPSTVSNPVVSTPDDLNNNILETSDTVQVKSPQASMAEEVATPVDRDESQPTGEVFLSAEDDKNDDKPVNVVAPDTTNRASLTGLSAKRRGKFMDVVRTPALESTDKQSLVSSKPVSRLGVEIAPIVSPYAPEGMQSPNSDIEPAPVNDVVKPRFSDDRELASKLAETAEREPTSQMAKSTDTSVEQPDVDVRAIESLVEKKTSVPSVDYPIKSSESLFIADAKVDKRPLGLQSSTEASDNSMPGTSDGSSQIASKARLPYELSSNIMAIESEKEVTRFQPQAVQTQDASTSPTPVKSSFSRARQSISKSAVASTPTPQLKGLESSEDQPAIYDPAYYKQETKPSTKSKSGWWVVFAIIGLIVLGGVGGVLYYLYSTGGF